MIEYLPTVLLGLVPVAVVGVLSMAQSHRIALQIHRVSKERGTAGYRLSIQNTEDLDLRVWCRVRCLISGDGAVFREPPAVFAGPRVMSQSLSEDGRSFSFDFNRLPAYATWVVHAEVEGRFQEFSLSVEPIDPMGKPAQRVLRSLSVDRVSIDESALFRAAGRTGPGAMRMAITGLVVGSGTYALASFWWMRGAHAHYSLDLVDLLMASIITLTALGLFTVGRTTMPRSVQGYLDPSPKPARVKS